MRIMFLSALAAAAILMVGCKEPSTAGLDRKPAHASDQSLADEHRPAPYVKERVSLNSCGIASHGGFKDEVCCSDDDCAGTLVCSFEPGRNGHCRYDLTVTYSHVL